MRAANPRVGATSSAPATKSKPTTSTVASQTATTRSGLTQTLTYDNANDRLVSVTDPGGHQLTFAYDSRGRITTVTDPAGNPITYAYATLTDGTSNLVSVTYPDNRIRSYLYNEAGLSLGNVPHALTGIQDENGARYMSYSYDAFGRAVGEQNGNGATTPQHLRHHNLRD